ncbi:helix-turn-helix transcriptional regulator [Isoptericola variabilis]|uniref:Regulatory protein ArsR n=1 Tax=Isoptericola variabilis (strain 225) TaxID=743718 RepID=F6FTI7_ISOV2|nr:helix-turn-helix domain-containing protein [Isoptericola variabilis]AEG43180.1 regulatory protein ArsR [Isoptericola variabilis 225]TWH35113.1 putative transcriptional regulators [Isoptericola variabilis J7]
MSDRPTTHLELTADAVKVLAHPLRSRLLTALRRGGPASATALAAELSTNTGATSYHLRRLESVGLVEDTGEGRGKERIWRASTESHGWRNSDWADDEDARTALGWLVRDYHRQFDAAYAHWLDVQDSWPAEWQDVSGMSDAWVHVTPAQAQAMLGEIEAVIERYVRAGAGDPAARRLHLYRFSFPLEADDVPAAPDADDGTEDDDAGGVP